MAAVHYIVVLFSDGAHSVWKCGREMGHQMYVIFCYVNCDVLK